MRDAVDSAPPGSVPVAQGDVLAGKYRVDHVLGLGGMGVVVAATHLQLDQKVALKFMLPEALRHPALIERFSREARAAVKLKSDHVARVLDVGTMESGSPYMVMEYLEGNDLGDLVERHGPMPVEVAVDCVLQACDALAEAHSLGIVHRDLKPRNLFMTRRNDGRSLVKVLDFGISKHAGATDLSLTRTSEIIGSPNYMSPEQLRSAKNADERSDIWALGVILYELLTGHVPFVAESMTELTLLVLTEPPRPLESLRADVPRDLVRVIQQCLAKDATQRVATVVQLAAALQPFAPADSRDLAARIARIGSKGGPAGAHTPMPLSGGTVANSGTGGNWSGSGSGPAPVAPAGKRSRGVLFAGVAGVLIVGAVVAGVAARRPKTADQGAMTGLTSAGATADKPRATGTSMDAPSAALVPVGSSEASSVTSTASAPSVQGLVPSPSSAAVASASVSAPAMASASGRGGAPAAAPGAGKRAGKTPSPTAPSSGADEPPRYRTSW